MSHKIFKSTFWVSIVIFVLTMGVTAALLFSFLESRTLDELREEANILSYGIEAQGQEYLNRINTDRRVTLIRRDGTVLYDNEADPSTMENHSNREEVEEAVKSGSGHSIRKSETMTRETIYFAQKLDDGTILRVAVTQDSIWAILAKLIRPAVILFMATVLLSLFLSNMVTKNILSPLNRLDLDHLDNNDVVYDELAPLLNRLQTQQETIRKQLNSAKQRQEEFNLITENMSEGFLVIDKNTDILSWNPSALRLLGMTDEPSGSVLRLNRTRDFRETIFKVLSGKKEELTLQRENRTYKLIANPAYDDNQEEVIGAVFVILDETESIKRENFRREFTANVSHELKTPLTSISGFAELMMGGGMPEETVMDFSKSIYDEASRLISLVNDIINLSSLDDENMEFDWEMLDLYQIASEEIRHVQAAADKKDVKIKLSGVHGNITGVRRIVSEMIYNLCDNAVKYNREHGSIDVNIATTTNHVIVSVQDTGIGIPEADQSRIFERFYRVDKSHSKAVGGTGLGLSIVKHGAQLHNAQIKVSSKLDKGTTITLRFRKHA
ncbi:MULTISPECIES: ATP-binding protein [unclassified Bilifractor]|uniref:sensor histidine kinase n=1 Tax=unclassified Bilifractor TaxID=2815795 RepID=UPI003F9062A4